MIEPNVQSPYRIAIVGVGALLPGAGDDPERFWANILNRVDAARDVPPGRWLLDPDAAFASGGPQPDKVYSRRGYFLDGIPFDPDWSELDPVVHLLLAAGRRAWADAVTAPLDPGRVGIILGNIALPTERVSALSRVLLGPVFAGDDPAAPTVEPLNRFAVGLPAGLLAQALGLGGGSVTLDAACASSLYALKLACDELRAGRADAMLAGGLNRSDSLYTQMGFSQLRALSPSGRCAPLDAAADGLMVGEGAGVFVLKRQEDAETHGDQIYGVITGIGLSNDIGGGLLAPATEGQLRAMRSAYRQAGWRPADVDLIECHATGTPVGDAVELTSLQELWSGEPSRPGRCALGAVKSTVGHLLTGAGAAGLLKVLLALKHKTLPPTANFHSPPANTEMDDSPFAILDAPRPWTRRDDRTPRRAAVNAFGFGGINAHVLIEEHTPASGVASTPRGLARVRVLQVHGTLTRPRSPVAVVGLGAHFGPWSDLSSFQQRALGGDTERAPQPTPDRPRPGYFIDSLRVPLDRFRIPPSELRETLPQQLLMLSVAAEALDDAGGLAEPPHTGAFIGLGLDLNTTNFHFRWSQPPELRDAAGPPLTANRVMGSLGSIAASRLARAFGLGGPCFTLCSEEASGARALELAVRTLQQGEVAQALVGAVDLAGDPRVLLTSPADRLPGEGAAALVLMRLDDAMKMGKRIYAVVEGVGVATGDGDAARRRAEADAGTGPAPVTFDAESDVGHAGAVSALASVVKACLALDRQILPAPRGPQFWLHDTADGPRRAAVCAASVDGNHVHVILAEHESTASADVRPLDTLPEVLFALDGDTMADLLHGLQRLHQRIDGRPLAALARRWWHDHRPDPSRRFGLALVARDADELRAQIDFATRRLRDAPGEPIRSRDHTGPIGALRDRVFYSPQPFGPAGELAFVYPGSGNHYPGIGRQLGVTWPAVLRRRQAESRRLRSQFAPHLFWDGDRDTPIDAQAVLFGQVCLGGLVSDLLAACGVRPATALGYSLGESAALFGLRAWRDADGMLARMQASSLFTTDLAGPCAAARAAWGLPEGEPVDWLTGVLDRSADEVRIALLRFPRTYLLIVNTLEQCVIGGQRPAVEALARHLGGRFHPIDGVTIAHCDVVRHVAHAYRELHRLSVTPPAGVRYYSGATGRAYALDTESAADAILGHASATLDFPRLIENAYADGVRLFVEVGPGASCSRMIADILGGRPHVARSACVARQDEVSTFLRLLAHLHAERVPLHLAALYGGQESAPRAAEGPAVMVPVGRLPFRRGAGRRVALPPPRTPGSEDSTRGCNPATPHGVPIRAFSQADGGGGDMAIPALASARVAAAQAHEAFLRFTATTHRHLANSFAFQATLLEQLVHAPASLCSPGGESGVDFTQHSALSTQHSALFLDRPGCLAFAVGKVGPVLGPAFAPIDAFPTRVRLPDEPLMLVDRITDIEGEPLSLTSGRIVTEHDIDESRWYLDNGRIPPSIAIESGQADLFLSGYLGIDFWTRGLAVYRLLDAAVTFHRGLPGPGATIRYDIRIERFFRQGDTHLFRFRFDGTVNGEPLLSMRDGCAGFFTAEELAAGKGVVLTELERRPQPGTLPVGWRPLVPFDGIESYDAGQLDALRRGDLAGCFGPAFAGLLLRDPLTLPATDKLRLIDRVTRLDPHGGRYGLGLIRAEADIHPDDWFLSCHFVDDQVMPGTLMYECCLHTLRVFLLRLGWVGEAAECAFEPVPGVASRLKCRGQVTAATRTVAYEVSVKELGYRPEPYAIADALMYADGKPIVDVRNMTLRLTGTNKEQMQVFWGNILATPRPESARGASASAPLADSGRGVPGIMVAFTREQVLAFATGKPSDAFGDRYRPFDASRFIARLPAPPYSFLDRVMSTTAEAWTMQAGGMTVAEYDVPPDAWYFAAARQPVMPYAVLLEAALQACGWTSAYVGSALHSDNDLHYRNLGGTATQFADVGPDAGTLRTTVTLTKVSKSAGMIIQHFDFAVCFADGRPVYRGDTYFGFFAKEALAQQVGLREAMPYEPTTAEEARGQRFVFPTEPPFPDRMLRMVDGIELFVPDGGPHGLGFVRGIKEVDSGEWFFQAHFHQDPVWPGSLGLEAFVQLLQVAAGRRWGATAGTRWQITAPGVPHTWIYRGQVVPGDRRVTVQAVVTRIEEDTRTLHADGHLLVDGRVIYQMNGFALRLGT